MDKNGFAALLDAIDQMAQKLVPIQKNAAKEHPAEGVMFVIITDGEENTGRKHSVVKAKAAIEKVKMCGW